VGAHKHCTTRSRTTRPKADKRERGTVVTDGSVPHSLIAVRQVDGRTSLAFHVNTPVSAPEVPRSVARLCGTTCLLGQRVLGQCQIPLHGHGPDRGPERTGPDEVLRLVGDPRRPNGLCRGTRTPIRLFALEFGTFTSADKH